MRVRSCTRGKVATQYANLKGCSDLIAAGIPSRRREAYRGKYCMIGLVIVTHGGLAQEFRSALEHVHGPQEQIAVISIGPSDDMDTRRSEIIQAVKDVDSGRGTILLTDMFGGTPSNLAISAMEQPNAEVIAGVNLPMLIKLASVRGDSTLDEAINEAQDAGRKYISVASKILKEK